MPHPLPDQSHGRHTHAQSVEAQYDRSIDALSHKLPKVADYLENAAGPTLGHSGAVEAISLWGIARLPVADISTPHRWRSATDLRAGCFQGRCRQRSGFRNPLMGVVDAQKRNGQQAAAAGCSVSEVENVNQSGMRPSCPPLPSHEQQLAPNTPVTTARRDHHERPTGPPLAHFPCTTRTSLYPRYRAALAGT